MGLQYVEYLGQSFPLSRISMIPISRRRQGIIVRTGGRGRLCRTRGRGCGVLHGALGHSHRGCAAPAAWAPYAAYYTLCYNRRTTSHLVRSNFKRSRAFVSFDIQFLSIIVT